jgi:VIT1/CCC1 family predicted Fe2+/Mn2+ transporter
MMRYELGLEKPDKNRATKSAITIGISYIVGGCIPLSPYLFFADALEGLYLSCCITLVCLFAFGYFKSNMTGQSPFGGGVIMMVIGAIAAGMAFLVAKSVRI